MQHKFRFLLALVLMLGTFFHALAVAAPKVHAITFGKWISVQWTAGSGTDDKAVAMKIRPLVVDGRVKEYVLGPPHEVTDRLFVVRRVFRVNDSLPEDAILRWQWQRGGWLLVDRTNGRIAALNLPDFDALYSVASWYRDYVAYCGLADDGKKTYAVVAQLGRRKPVLKKIIGEGISDDAAPDSACSLPEWQRGPVRVSFESRSSKQTFAIRGHVVDLVVDDDDEGD
ncbi:MAG TPA: hypothetical protein VMP68_13920 [Candidatus Eisenbacteria bacterium]|nr:hypothetical protein [Candidatus Eisenbacteria bacterium]